MGSDPAGGTGGVDTFDGLIDEVAVFTNAMTEGQVQDLYLKSLGLNSGVAPTYTLQPASNTLVYAGQTLVISCLAGGIPSPTYQWQALNGTKWQSLGTGGNSTPTNSTLYYSNYTGSPTSFRCQAVNTYGAAISSTGKVTMLSVPNNGQWTVDFAVISTDNGGNGLVYGGIGVLGTGTYWNALSGSQLTSSTSYRDNGATVSGISFGSTGYPYPYSSVTDLPVDNALLDTWCQITPTNVFVFHNVPNGRYNLALYGCVGGWVNRGTIFTVNGVSQSVINVQDSFFLPDNTVIYTNVLVSNGSLEVDMATVPATPVYPISTEGDFNGAQIQLVKYGPDILSMTNSGANFILTYAGGQLLESTNIAGGWTTNLTATSPFTIYPTGQMKFYRVYSSSNY